ncbi:hypothetical protein SAMN05428936_102232 [Pelagibacterium halotolerans]|nr:hypothetical protein SAMN05428936_102232 [Pelagibacterium halotolerans]
MERVERRRNVISAAHPSPLFMQGFITARHSIPTAHQPLRVILGLSHARPHHQHQPPPTSPSGLPGPITTPHPTPIVILGLDPGIRCIGQPVKGLRSRETRGVATSALHNSSVADPRVKPEDDAGEGEVPESKPLPTQPQKTLSPLPCPRAIVPARPHQRRGCIRASGEGGIGEGGAWVRALGPHRPSGTSIPSDRPIRVPCGSPQGRPKRHKRRMARTGRLISDAGLARLLPPSYRGNPEGIDPSLLKGD